MVQIQDRPVLVSVTVCQRLRKSHTSLVWSSRTKEVLWASNARWRAHYYFSSKSHYFLHSHTFLKRNLVSTRTLRDFSTMKLGIFRNMSFYSMDFYFLIYTEHTIAHVQHASYYATGFKESPFLDEFHHFQPNSAIQPWMTIKKTQIPAQPEFLKPIYLRAQSHCTHISRRTSES